MAEKLRIIPEKYKQIPVQSWPVEMRRVEVSGPRGEKTLEHIEGGAFQVLFRNPLSDGELAQRLYGARDVYTVSWAGWAREKLEKTIRPLGFEMQAIRTAPDDLPRYTIVLPQEGRHARLAHIKDQRAAIIRKLDTSTAVHNVWQASRVRRKVTRSIERLDQGLAETQKVLDAYDIPFPAQEAATGQKSFRETVQGRVLQALGYVNEHPQDSYSGEAVPSVDIGQRQAVKEESTDVQAEQRKVPEQVTFGQSKLTHFEVALIVSVLAERREEFRLFFQQQKIPPLAEEVMARFVTSAKVQTLPDNLQDRTEKTKRAFSKVDKMVTAPRFNQELDEILKQDQDVWELLVHISDIVPVVRKGKQAGAAFHTLLQTALSNMKPALAADPPAAQEFDEHISIADYQPHNPELQITEAQKRTGIEARNPQIRQNISDYLNDIVAKPELGKRISPASFTRAYPRATRTRMDWLIKEGAVPVSLEGGKIYFDHISGATLLYLIDHEGLPPQQKKDIRNIVKEEYDKRQEQEHS